MIKKSSITSEFDVDIEDVKYDVVEDETFFKEQMNQLNTTKKLLTLSSIKERRLRMRKKRELL